MAIVGTAKNARVTVRPAFYYGYWGIYVRCRGGGYSFLSADTDHHSVIVREKPAWTDIAKTVTHYVVSAVDICVLEAIDNVLSFYLNGVLVATATDSMWSEAGVWEVLEGTLVSFENLDAPAPTGTNMQINIAGVWKPVESAQINVGGTWKPVAAGSKINIGGVWKTIF